MTQACYLYLLRFCNGESYVGMSNNPERRLRKYHAIAPSACGAAIRKHGMPALVLIAESSRDQIAELERFLIADMGPKYNIARGGEGCSLRSGESEERRRRALSTAMTGKKLSPEHCEAIRRARVGMRYPNKRPMSDAQRRSMSESAKKRWARDRDRIMAQRATPEYRDAVSRGVAESWKTRDDRNPSS